MTLADGALVAAGGEISTAEPGPGGGALAGAGD
jgi:hypothetical protein